MSLLTNPRFKTFRDKLDAAGIVLRRAWEAPISEAHGTEVVCYTVMGGKHACTIVVVDYGERDGFAIYFDGATADMDKDVERLLAGDFQERVEAILALPASFGQPDEAAATGMIADIRKLVEGSKA